MSSFEQAPPPLGPEWKPWGERLIDFLSRTKSRLAYYLAGDTAAEDGIILWDRTGYPVVSKNGEWRQVILADGYGEFSAASSITAASANTAYSIAFTTVVANGGISINVSDNTRIDVSEAGVYKLSGHLQLKSSSGSSKTLYYWLAVNGVDLDHSERTTVSANNQEVVLAVSDQVNLSAGDYINVKWATSSTALWLDSSVATAFAPASEPIHISVSRIRQ